MKIRNLVKFSCLCLCSFNFFSAYSQVTVDADLKEWGDMKKMSYDSENKLYYAFKKDSNFLYMAIYKNEYAGKYSNGGVQLFFNAQGAKKDSLMLTFAHTYTDSTTHKLVHRTHDYFLLENFNGIKKQLVPKFNEMGILLEWNYTNIDHIPREDKVMEHIPANPNIFTAEVQIPLTYLIEKFNKELVYKICLRGSDITKKGKEAFFKRRLFTPELSNTAFVKDIIDRSYFTEFNGNLNLNTIN
ncbi:hypothetical protein [Pedobacter sp. MW01-1-1]|uniref:hypothetical protein n=1 Tax=Pedobacter sp. MW01-1-1 TaxID=3383027 RepID=UPI003FF050F2